MQIIMNSLSCRIICYRCVCNNLHKPFGSLCTEEMLPCGNVLSLLLVGVFNQLAVFHTMSCASTIFMARAVQVDALELGPFQ